MTVQSVPVSGKAASPVIERKSQQNDESESRGTSENLFTQQKGQSSSLLSEVPSLERAGAIDQSTAVSTAPDREGSDRFEEQSRSIRVLVTRPIDATMTMLDSRGINVQAPCTYLGHHVSSLDDSPVDDVSQLSDEHTKFKEITYRNSAGDVARIAVLIDSTGDGKAGISIGFQLIVITRCPKSSE